MSKIRQKLKEDVYIDSVLRPSSWSDYIGQEKIKKNLALILSAAKKRRESSDHLLFYGPAGLGKTTLATLAAKEMGVELKVTTGPALERAGDLAAIISSLEEGDVLFIDEAHRLNRSVEEMLYPAMESRQLHLVVGKGLGSRMMTLDLPAFTLIAATTRVNLLSSPLRSRFGAIFKLDYYTLDDIKAIIGRSAKILGIELSSLAVDVIASASRFTPRIANRLLKRSRDYVQVNNKKVIDEKIAIETLKFLEIDTLGLEYYERHLLETIIKKFGNRPIGINTMTAALGEEKGVIEEVYEPYLIKLGLLQRTQSGRIATDKAYKHLNLEV